MWVLTCEHAVHNWLLFRIGRCLLFWSSCSGWPGHKVECKGDLGGQVVHWRCQHCQLCLAGGPTSWKNPLLNYCILTFCRWWVCLSWTPPCQKEQETKTGKTVVRIWILPSRTQGVTTIAVALLFKSHFWASTKKPYTKLKSYTWITGAGESRRCTSTSDQRHGFEAGRSGFIGPGDCAGVIVTPVVVHEKRKGKHIMAFLSDRLEQGV